LYVLSFKADFSDFPGSVVSSTSEIPQRLQSVFDQASGDESQEEGPGPQHMSKVEPVELARFFPEKRMVTLKAKSRDLTFRRNEPP